MLDRVLNRLVANEILEQEIGGFWSVARQVSRSGTYRAADGTVRQEVRSRIRQTIVENEIPDPRDVIIIGLVNSCDAFRYLLPEEDYEEFRDRIGFLSRMALVSRAIAAAVAEGTIRLSSRATAMTKPIPAVNLFALPFKRSFWQGNLAKLTAELYRKYGPVFMLKAPFVKRGIAVIAGPDANTWMNRKARLHVRNKDCLADWEKVYGANRTLPGMDGAEHYRLRKAQRPSYSRAALEGRLDELYEQARAGLRAWKAGDVLPGGAACRALMGSELSRLTVGIDTSEYILDLVAYKERSLITHVQHSLPKFMLHTPASRTSSCSRILGIRLVPIQDGSRRSQVGRGESGGSTASHRSIRSPSTGVASTHCSALSPIAGAWISTIGTPSPHTVILMSTEKCTARSPRVSMGRVKE